MAAAIICMYCGAPIVYDPEAGLPTSPWSSPRPTTPPPAPPTLPDTVL
jgi:hypothetical protein